MGRPAAVMIVHVNIDVGIMATTAMAATAMAAAAMTTAAMTVNGHSGLAADTGTG
jgi:hypothetical protein